MQTKNTSVHLAILVGDALVSLLSAAFVFILISKQRGAELLGQYSLVLAWTTLFQAIGSFGIPEFTVREIGRRYENAGRVLTQGIVAGLAASSLSTVVIVLLQGLIPSDEIVQRALLIGALSILPATISSTFRGALLAHRKVGLVFILGIAENLSLVLMNAYWILHGAGVAYLVATILGSKLLGGCVGILLTRKGHVQFQKSLDLPAFKEMWKTILTFGVSNWLSLLAKRINVTMLSFSVSYATIGHYSAANAFAEMSFMIPIVLSQLLLPRLSQGLARKSSGVMVYYERMVVVMLSLTIPLAIGLCFFAKFVIQIVFGLEFSDSVVILQILMVVFIMDCADTLMSILLKAAGFQKADVAMFVGNPVLNIGANLLLIPLFGGGGAALAKGAAVLFSLVMRSWYLARRQLTVPWLRLGLKPLLVSLLLAAVLAPLRSFIPDLVLFAIYSVVSVVVFFWSCGLSVKDFEAPGLESPAGSGQSQQSLENDK